VLHRVVSNLLLQTGLVCLQELLDLRHSHFFLVKLSLQVVCFRELVLDIILHLRDLILGLFHFFVDTAF